MYALGLSIIEVVATRHHMVWFGLVWLGWVGFYGISTLVSYLMPNPFHTYILNMFSKHIL